MPAKLSLSPSWTRVAWIALLLTIGSLSLFGLVWASQKFGPWEWAGFVGLIYASAIVGNLVWEQEQQARWEEQERRRVEKWRDARASEWQKRGW